MQCHEEYPIRNDHLQIDATLVDSEAVAIQYWNIHDDPTPDLQRVIDLLTVFDEFLVCLDYPERFDYHYHLSVYYLPCPANEFKKMVRENLNEKISTHSILFAVDIPKDKIDVDEEPTTDKLIKMYNRNQSIEVTPPCIDGDPTNDHPIVKPDRWVKQEIQHDGRDCYRLATEKVFHRKMFGSEDTEQIVGKVAIRNEKLQESDLDTVFMSFEGMGVLNE